MRFTGVPCTSTELRDSTLEAREDDLGAVPAHSGREQHGLPDSGRFRLLSVLNRRLNSGYRCSTPLAIVSVYSPLQ